MIPVICWELFSILSIAALIMVSQIKPTLDCFCAWIKDLIDWTLTCFLAYYFCSHLVLYHQKRSSNAADIGQEGMVY